MVIFSENADSVKFVCILKTQVLFAATFKEGCSLVGILLADVQGIVSLHGNVQVLSLKSLDLQVKH